MTELEKANQRIAALEAQEVELCTLYGIVQAENGKLRADLEAIGAGGVSGPLMGGGAQPALSAGWVSVDERLPEPNVEVLCAGRGWGNSFVTACYYDDERREWRPINTHWTDSNGSAQYPTHWRELPPAPPLASEAKDLT